MFLSFASFVADISEGIPRKVYSAEPGQPYVEVSVMVVVSGRDSQFFLGTPHTDDTQRCDAGCTSVCLLELAQFLAENLV